MASNATPTASMPAVHFAVSPVPPQGKQRKSAKHIATKVGNAILRYGVGYPVYMCGVLVCCLCFRKIELCGTGRIERRRRKEKIKLLRSQIPMPLGHERKRRLSLPLDGDDGMTGKRVGWLMRRQKTRVQEGSGLLKLPAEVRATIWEYAMGGRDVRIVPGPKSKFQPGWLGRREWKKKGGLGISVKRLAFRDVTTSLSEDLETDSLANIARDQDKDDDVDKRSDGWRPMSVLLTCRQFYSETIQVLYKCNIFHFDSAQLLMNFTTTVPSSRTTLITSIVFAEHLIREDLLPQYTLTEAFVLLSPPSSFSHGTQRAHKTSEINSHPLPNLKDVTLDLFYMECIHEIFWEIELQHAWDRVYQPFVEFAPVMAARGSELIVRTAWREWGFERDRIGPGGSKVKGLRMVRPGADGHWAPERTDETT